MCMICVFLGAGLSAAGFLPGESQGRGSRVGCCLWGRTESDTAREVRSPCAWRGGARPEKEQIDFSRIISFRKLLPGSDQHHMF